MTIAFRLISLWSAAWASTASSIHRRRRIAGDVGSCAKDRPEGAGVIRLAAALDA
jgi:hypothetical protein